MLITPTFQFHKQKKTTKTHWTAAKEKELPTSFWPIYVQMTAVHTKIVKYPRMIRASENYQIRVKSTISQSGVLVVLVPKKEKTKKKYSLKTRKPHHTGIGQCYLCIPFRPTHTHTKRRHTSNKIIFSISPSSLLYLEYFLVSRAFLLCVACRPKVPAPKHYCGPGWLFSFYMTQFWFVFFFLSPCIMNKMRWHAFVPQHAARSHDGAFDWISVLVSHFQVYICCCCSRYLSGKIPAFHSNRNGICLHII